MDFHSWAHPWCLQSSTTGVADVSRGVQCGAVFGPVSFFSANRGREPYAKLSFFSFSIQVHGPIHHSRFTSELVHGYFASLVHCKGYQVPFALLFFQLLIGILAADQQLTQFTSQNSGGPQVATFGWISWVWPLDTSTTSCMRLGEHTQT